jgi:hypothetical protein
MIFLSLIDDAVPPPKAVLQMFIDDRISGIRAFLEVIHPIAAAKLSTFPVLVDLTPLAQRGEGTLVIPQARMVGCDHTTRDCVGWCCGEGETAKTIG